ncbi:ERG4/ERG24 ergosterol biosynthesis protein [Ganoderma leucocontextum]|nr:ERG4/ERG24 ergosterol biosynthesis protein [Ganoderma leucocontextum]
MHGLYFGCSEQTGGCPPALDTTAIVAALSSWTCTRKGLWDTEAALAYLAWYAYVVVAWLVLPGEWVEGTVWVMRDGRRKKYRINAFSTGLLALGVTAVVLHWVGLLTASTLMSLVQASVCYVPSFRDGALLALGGNTGSHIYDFNFIGRELNPSIGSFDLKSFNELRPGLILGQAVRRGSLANITDSMWLVLVFQGWYTLDAVYNEPGVFTAMDITTDGFGFMLASGSAITWARYLVFNQIELGPFYTGLILGVNFLGYYIFRTANRERNDFRDGKKPQNLRYTLLTSGWWGRSRHPEYLGDLLKTLAWSLPTGFNTPITYFYVTWFALLLVYRERRDGEACEKKYGKDWIKYKQLVRWRIIPYVY